MDSRVFIKRAGDVNSVFAEVTTHDGDTVSRLAERASTTFRWLTSADKIKLYIVPNDLRRTIQLDISLEASVLVDKNICLATDILADANIFNSSCILARLLDPPLSVGVDHYLTLLEKVDKVFKVQQEILSKAERERLLRLIIRPSAPSKTSPSQASAREEKELRRLGLKLRVLTYYGLLVSCEGNDKSLWTARTMMDDTDSPPKPLKACTLAHIWPSEKEMLASQIAQELNLPEGFYTEPRNYLILPKDAHDGFDNESLLFMPSSGGTIKVRKWRLEDRSLEEIEAISKYDGRRLSWSLEDTASPNLPFMRLLAFRMILAHVNRPASILDDDVLMGIEQEQEAALNASFAPVDNQAVRDLCSRLSLF